MARVAWAVVAVAALVGSYMACQNTWKGLQKDTKENTAIAKQKAKEARLDEKAQKAGAEVREAARETGEGIKNAVSRIRGDKGQEAPAVQPSAPAPSASRSARDVNDAIGKVAAKTQEVGHEVVEQTESGAIHLDVRQALAREPGLTASGIDIDVDAEARSIVLRGSVPDVAQKATAERLAREHAHGCVVRNELALLPAAAR